MADAPPEVVEELYAAAPEDFVSTRDARARELRKEDRAAADAVKRLRRPSVSAAAVNRLARESRDDVDALLAAGEALRQAQLGGGDRDAIRAASQDERAAVERLVADAGDLSAAALEEVRETLHAAASDDEARELIRRGVLTEARRAVGLGGGLRAAPAAGRKAPKAADRRAAKKNDAGRAGARAARAADRRAEARRGAEEERRAEAERRKAARERVRTARAALREAERAAAAADREAKSAHAELELRRKELDGAESER